MEFRNGIVFARLRMNETRNGPFTFRLSPDVEKRFLSALQTLGWTKTKLVNEALEIALPVILDRQAAKFSSPTAAAGEALIRSAKRPKP